MPSLYRKHRPQSWDAVAGQTVIKRVLEQELKDNTCAHAYLFAGPRGVGKTSVARILAKAINCSSRASGASNPCNECPNCVEIAAGKSLDVLEIDAASNTGVDHVREHIIENARFAPAKASHKIYIIDEVHMLSTAAFNALLKIIEEPPAHVVFIMATTELEKVPDTVISRCQRFDFKKIPTGELIARLDAVAREEGVDVAHEVFERIARQSEGSLRDAESLLGQLCALNITPLTAEIAESILPRFPWDKCGAFFKTIIDRDTKNALALINALAEEGADLPRFHEHFIDYARIAMLAKYNPSLAETAFHLNDTAREALHTMVSKVEGSCLMHILEETITAQKWWGHARLYQLPLELLALKLTAEDKDVASPARVPTPVKSVSVSVSSPTSISTPIQSGTMHTTAYAEKKTTPAAAAASLPKKPSVEAPAPQESSAASIPQNIPVHTSLDEIKQKWNDLIKKAQSFNHSLPVILKMSEPVSLVGNVLRIGVKYAFHRDKIAEHKMKELVEKALFEVWGASLIIQPVMIESANESPATGTGIGLTDLLDTFGGSVISPS